MTADGDCWHSQQKNNLLSSTPDSVHPSVDPHTLSKVQMLEKIATAWIISSHGKQTDDSYEMSLYADLL